MTAGPSAAFSSQPAVPAQVATDLALAAVVLVGNAASPSAALSAFGAVCGLAMRIVRPPRPTGSHAGWATPVVLVPSGILLAAAAVLAPQDGLVALLARVGCGVAWVTWLAGRLDWPALRDLLDGAGAPHPALRQVDAAVAHGASTARAWAHRRDAARVRLGRARLSPHTWAAVIGEGAWTAFDHAEQATQLARLRSTPPVDEGGLDCVLDAVTVTRGTHDALRHATLRVPQGSWIAVCGPSGAGKTTLLHTLAGLIAPSAGTVDRGRTRITPTTPLAQRLDGRIALLPQNPEHHFVASTVGADIAWALRARGVPPDAVAARCDAALQRLDAAHLRDRPCHALSLGEQRRAALAGLWAQQPRLLLLDEPTAGLDPVAARAVIQEVAQLVADGTTCVWTTHDLHLVPAGARRVVLMRDHTILFDGAARDALSTPWLARAGLAADPEPSP